MGGDIGSKAAADGGQELDDAGVGCNGHAKANIP